MYIDRIKRTLNGYEARYGGGGKGSAPTVQTVAATPPPAPPAEEATMKEFSDPELDKAKVKAKTSGATSLQIPLGTVGSGSIGTV